MIRSKKFKERESRRKSEIVRQRRSEKVKRKRNSESMTQKVRL